MRRTTGPGTQEHMDLWGDTMGILNSVVLNNYVHVVWGGSRITKKVYCVGGGGGGGRR